MVVHCKKIEIYILCNQNSEAAAVTSQIVMEDLEKELILDVNILQTKTVLILCSGVANELW